MAQETDIMGSTGVAQRADAADWVEQRLAQPQASGVTRVFYHSIVRQYIGAASRARLEAAMAAAGAQSGLRFEPNRHPELDSASIVPHAPPLLGQDGC